MGGWVERGMCLLRSGWGSERDWKVAGENRDKASEGRCEDGRRPGLGPGTGTGPDRLARGAGESREETGEDRGETGTNLGRGVGTMRPGMGRHRADR